MGFLGPGLSGVFRYLAAQRWIRRSSVAEGDRAMALFQPFRALGLITDAVPFAVQRRGAATFVTVSVGKAWQVMGEPTGPFWAALHAWTASSPSPRLNAPALIVCRSTTPRSCASPWSGLRCAGCCCCRCLPPTLLPGALFVCCSHLLRWFNSQPCFHPFAAAAQARHLRARLQGGPHLCCLPRHDCRVPARAPQRRVPRRPCRRHPAAPRAGGQAAEPWRRPAAAGVAHRSACSARGLHPAGRVSAWWLRRNAAQRGHA